MIIKLTGIPDTHCRLYDGAICPYYDNEGGHDTCRLWDFLGVTYKQERTTEGVINTVCTWTKKVVV
jgi:hypothetical protein